MPSERAVSASPRFHEDIHVMPEVGQEIYPNTRSSWTSENHQLGPNPSLSKPLTSFSPRKTVMSGIQRESSLFSSSFSELFSRKLQLMRNNGLPSQSANIVASHLEEEETFQSLEETEAQTIGNLLPDEDDFFNGLVDEAGHNSHTSKVDDMDDFDLFSSGGGMELEANLLSTAGQINSGSSVGVSDGRRVASGLLVGEHPDGEVPSRTLFVQNIHSNVKDSDLKVLFERFGDIRALYTASKNRGFVMVSYFDIRAAQNALRLLRRRRLDIHYSFPKENPSEADINRDTLLVSNLDSSISDDDVHKILGVYGEIREICDTTDNNSQKFVEFFDVRAADAARLSLNGIEIAGKQIKLEPSGSRGARSFLPQYGQEDAEPRLVQRSFKNSSSPHIGRISPAIFASSSMNAGPVHVFPNLVHSPANSFSEPNQSFSIPIGLSSSTRVMSNGKIIGLQEPNFSFDEKMGNHSLSNLHSHSFPEFNENFACNSSYKSSKTFAEMVGSGQTLNEDFINSSIRSAGSNGHQIGFNGGVMGSSLKESSLHGNPWNNLNSQQQRLSTPMVWPNSPSYIDGIHSRVPHVAAFSRAPPVMVNASSSPVHHHIGSAPAMNHTFWDMKHAYDAESLESSSFNLGSHGRFGNSPSHPMDIASHNIFTHLGGGRIDVNPANPVPCSPQQMSHFFPGRNPMISTPGSYGSPSERFRNLSQRRNDSSSNNADKKLYELDIDRILNGEDSRTTLMIKNIPNKYTSKMLLAAIDEYCKGTYDFIYLPIDFKNKCNVGYAFINLIDPQKIVPFYKAFNGKKWEKFNSEKVASLAYARIQGKSALISHFQNSSLMNEDKRCRPILFHTEGPNAGDQEPFPMGSNIRSRAGKPRSSNEGYNQFNSSASENQEEM